MNEPEPAHDEEHYASLKGMGLAIASVREERGMSCEEVAQKSEMTVEELEAIERGERHEWWGGLRRIAEALFIPLSTLMKMAEERAPGPGGEKWRRRAEEAETDSAEAGAQSDAAEGGN